MNKLDKTYNVFFGNFKKLRPIQELTIPLVLAKENGLIIAPTASGKTEAVIAPICEILLKEKKDDKNRLKVLYIVPTKALVSDLLKRLTDKVTGLGISIAGRTGDTRTFSEKSPQEILITTPETTDSLISRYPELLENLQFIVIDEIHFLDNTYRGDQIRVLLKRIKKNLVSDELTIFCISATVNDPKKLMDRYLKNGKVIENKENNREILFIPVDISKSENFKKFRDYTNEYKIKKILAFCNSKKETIRFCEELKEIFYEKKDRIFEHHAAIDRKERKRIEDELAKDEFSICVCTTTLEIGIDIGDIDVVILKNPPLTVSSFLQRVGRGNRRTNITRCLGFYENIDEKQIFETMKDDAINGKIEFLEYIPDISVCVQQILSLSYQNYNNVKLELDENKIIDFLKPLNFKDNVILQIVDHLINEERLIERVKVRDKTFIFPSKKLQNFIEKPLTRARINSNIPQKFNDVEVIDQNGKKIGVIAPPENMDSFTFAAKKWAIKDFSKKKIIVEQTSFATEIPSFNSSKYGYFYFHLPKEYQKISNVKDWLNDST